MHPWEYIYSTHRRIREKLKLLGYKVNDGLDIDDGKDVRPTETMREVYDNIAIRE